MHDPTSPRRISSPRALPGPSRCSWPRNSSSLVGRMRAARGSPLPRLPLPWKSVGSDTGERGMGKGEGDHGDALFGAGMHEYDVMRMRKHNHIGAMKQLASLEAWKCANALARSAYRLTLRKPLSTHFGLSD